MILLLLLLLLSVARVRFEHTLKSGPRHHALALAMDAHITAPRTLSAPVVAVHYIVVCYKSINTLVPSRFS